jgi:hypothetical protein
MNSQLRIWARLISPVGLCGLLFFGKVSPTKAGGFTQPQGRTFTSITLRTFSSDDFEKLELEGYIEYGLQDDVTLILKIPYNWIENEVGDEDFSNAGFTDAEVAVRWRFNDLDSSVAASVQGTVLVPMGYDADADLALGRGAVGLELRLPVSQGYQLGERNGYWTVEAAYRQYLDTEVSNEVRLLGEVSQDVIDRLAVAAQVEQVFTLQENERFRNEETDFTKLTGQLRFRTTDRLTLVVGGFTNVAGAEGHGLEAKIWYLFD